VILRPLFHLVRAVVLLRLRRSLLEEEHRQDDVHPHLQELTLPVLEDRLAELGGAQELAERHRLLPMLLLFLVVGRPSRQRVPGEAEQKQHEDDDGEVVVSPHVKRKGATRLPSGRENSYVSAAG